MKRFLCVLGLAAVLGGCGKHGLDDPAILDRTLEEAVVEGELQERGPEGAKLLYVPNKQTPYSGWVKEMYSNGQVESLWQVKDGKKEGMRVGWHENGQKWYENKWKDGELDGVSVAWFENGQKYGEFEWKDGELDGVSVAWFENGQKSQENEWNDGLLIDSVSWKPNGEKGSEVIDGNGVGTMWHENGQKSAEANWKDGRKHGLRRRWDEDGKLIFAETYKNGVVISEKEYSMEQGNAETSEPTEQVHRMVMEVVRKTEAKKDVQDLKTAISTYYLEYGRFPYGGEQDVELNTEDDDIMSVLAGVEGNPLNSRGKVFYQGKRAKNGRDGNPTGGIYGEGDDLRMVDPWGQPYYIIIDANYDNKVQNPVSGGVLRQTIIVWSKGKPREKGVANDPRYWLTSW